MAASSSAVDPNTQRKHHKKVEDYEERPKYRKGRVEKAVKVYTVNMESRYLLIMNVPTLGVTKNLLEQMALYGEIEEYRILFEYPCEEFTEVYWVKYRDLDASRAAKRKVDGRPFFSNCLHVCYAPEFETVEETREKLEQRRQVLARKTRYMSTKHTSAAKPTVRRSATGSETVEGSTSSHQHMGSISVRTDLDTPTVSLSPQTCSLPPLPAPPTSAPPPLSSDQMPYPSMMPKDAVASQHTSANTAVRPSCGGLSLEERLSLHQAWVGGPKVHEMQNRGTAEKSVHSVSHGAHPQQGGGAGQPHFSYYEPPSPEEGVGQQTKCLSDRSLTMLRLSSAQIGSRSVEKSVLRVREHMKKVLEPSATPASSAGLPKKRKRI